MDVHLILESIGVLAGGVLLTLGLTLLSLAIGFMVSVPLGFVRASSNRVFSGAVLSYTYTFRGTPLLVQLFLVYYGLGQLEIVRESDCAAARALVAKPPPRARTRAMSRERVSAFRSATMRLWAIKVFWAVRTSRSPLRPAE